MGIPKKHLIYGALTFFSLLGAMIKVMFLDEPGRGALALYLAVIYAIFALWAVGELRTIHLREQEEAAAPPEAAILAQLEPLTENQLNSAETYLDLGEGLETVSQVIEPRYQNWELARKQAFRQKLRAAIDERRAGERRQESI